MMWDGLLLISLLFSTCVSLSGSSGTSVADCGDWEKKGFFAGVRVSCKLDTNEVSYLSVAVRDMVNYLPVTPHEDAPAHRLKGSHRALRGGNGGARRVPQRGLTAAARVALLLRRVPLPTPCVRRPATSCMRL